MLRVAGFLYNTRFIWWFSLSQSWVIHDVRLVRFLYDGFVDKTLALWWLFSTSYKINKANMENSNLIKKEKHQHTKLTLKDFNPIISYHVAKQVLLCCGILQLW
jgi:hypothetical protein